jgi:hypothetical protein
MADMILDIQILPEAVFSKKSTKKPTNFALPYYPPQTIAYSRNVCAIPKNN